MYKKIVTGLLLIANLALSGCSKTDVADSPVIFESRWNDPNFKILSASVVNYTTTGIYDGYILPLDKNDIDFGIIVPGSDGTLIDAKEWSLGGGNSPILAWNYQWTVPKKFKIWWQVIFDKTTYDADNTYDRYTNKGAAPGTAWCESEITIRQPAEKNRNSYLALYFYPDGHTEGNIIFDKLPILDIHRRTDLPVLTSGQHCLKEVSNPHYGKKKPISIN